VTIAAGVIGLPLVTTPVALKDVAAEPGSATYLNRMHYFQMRQWQSVTPAVSFSILTKDVG
jgi:hypothetical protein